MKTFFYIFIFISIFLIGCGGDTSSNNEPVNVLEIEELPSLGGNETTQSISYKYLIDGDTFYSYEFEESIRLLAVDTPESKFSNRLVSQANSCASGDQNLIIFMGEESSSFSRDILENNFDLEISLFGSDIYDRNLGIIYYNNKLDNLNSKLVRFGYATPFLDTENRFAEDLSFAKTNKLGLWENYFTEMECLENLNN